MRWPGKKKPSNKYRGRRLSAETIDAQQKSNDHKRRERQKNIEHYALICAIIGAMIAIPVLYIFLLIVNKDSPAQETTYLWSGLTAAVGFVFGKKTGKNKD